MRTQRQLLLPAFGAGILLTLGAAIAAGSAHADAGGVSSAAAPAAVTSSSSSAPAAPAAPATCPTVVTISSVVIQKNLSGGQVVVTIVHDGQGCPSATPAKLHVHQNLLKTPQAGSDPAHQTNNNYTVGPDFGDSVVEPLMASVPGECFVQVDASAGTIRTGRFFPTADCASTSSSTPPPPPSSSTSTAPPSCAITTVPGLPGVAPADAAVPAASCSSTSTTTPPTTPPTTPVTSHTTAHTTAHTTPATHSASVSGVSTSRVVQRTDPVHSVALARTGLSIGRTAGLAATLVAAGLWLLLWSRDPRRQH